MSHEVVEKNVGMLMILIVVAISFAGLVQFVPLFSMKNVTTPSEGVKRYSVLQLVGRDLFIREGCVGRHSQMIRPFRNEVERYGEFSIAGESVYDRPFLFGSKRTGPDLARVGDRYSDDWHITHLINPRDIVPESNMPAFPHLARNLIDGEDIVAKLKGLNFLYNLTCTGCEQFSEEEIATAKETVKGVREIDALVSYLQFLGHSRKY